MMPDPFVWEISDLYYNTIKHRPGVVAKEFEPFRNARFALWHNKDNSIFKFTKNKQVIATFITTTGIPFTVRLDIYPVSGENVPKSLVKMFNKTYLPSIKKSISWENILKIGHICSKFSRAVPITLTEHLHMDDVILHAPIDVGFEDDNPAVDFYDNLYNSVESWGICDTLSRHYIANPVMLKKCKQLRELDKHLRLLETAAIGLVRTYEHVQQESKTPPISAYKHIVSQLNYTAYMRQLKYLETHRELLSMIKEELAASIPILTLLLELINTSNITLSSSSLVSNITIIRHKDMLMALQKLQPIVDIEMQAIKSLLDTYCVANYHNDSFWRRQIHNTLKILKARGCSHGTNKVFHGLQ